MLERQLSRFGIEATELSYNIKYARPKAEAAVEWYIAPEGFIVTYRVPIGET